MSGTFANLAKSGGGIMLPAPKVQMYVPAAPVDIFVAGQSPIKGLLVQVKAERFVKVTVPGIPDTVLSDLTKYAPQVELLRYIRNNSRENAAGGNGNKSAGYVHPAHGVAPYGGSFTHGGTHGGSDPAVQAIRPTEWAITSGADAIDVTQGVLGFMCLSTTAYREPVTGYSTTEVLVPSHALSRGRGLRGSRFPYEKKMGGAYFAFRISIKDPSDSRGKRIWGPMSEIIQCGNALFPFVPAGVDAVNRAQANLHPQHEPLNVNFWHVSRQP